jgi:hypothetical protein
MPLASSIAVVPQEDAMKTYTFGPLITGVLATICLVPALAAAQEPTVPPPSLAALDTPHALRMEDRHLREDLARAAKDGGAVGAAARELQRLLAPHLDEREKVVFLPLGLLRALARDESGINRAPAIAAVDQIERELPKLEREHRAIYDANKRLIDAANREHKPEYLDVSDRLWVHIRLEEEVLYPTVILVGRYLKLQEHGRSRATSKVTP